MLENWNHKVKTDASFQNVVSKRLAILVKKKRSSEHHAFAVLWGSLATYSDVEIEWQWSSPEKTGLCGYRKSDNFCVYRWHPNQKQLFQRFNLCKGFSVEDFSVQAKKISLGEFLKSA